MGALNFSVSFDFEFGYIFRLFLGAGTAAFTSTSQLVEIGDVHTNFPVHVWTLCDWKTAWSLLFKPIETDREREKIKKELQVCNSFNRFS